MVEKWIPKESDTKDTNSGAAVNDDGGVAGTIDAVQFGNKDPTHSQHFSLDDLNLPDKQVRSQMGKEFNISKEGIHISGLSKSAETNGLVSQLGYAKESLLISEIDPMHTGVRYSNPVINDPVITEIGGPDQAKVKPVNNISVPDIADTTDTYMSNLYIHADGFVEEADTSNGSSSVYTDTSDEEDVTFQTEN